ncbi:C-C motif chemokine 4, partial [Clarias magur]
SSPASAAIMSRSVLLVLLVLTCLQDFAVPQSAKGPEDCCFNFFKRPIPIKLIKTYENTSNDCPKSGV